MSTKKLQLVGSLNNIEIDTTLTRPGYAADAYEIGEKLNEMNVQINHVDELIGDKSVAEQIGEVMVNKSDVGHVHTAAQVGADVSGAAEAALSSANNYTDGQIAAMVGTQTVTTQICTVENTLNAAIATKADISSVTALQDLVGDEAVSEQISDAFDSAMTELSTTSEAIYNALGNKADLGKMKIYPSLADTGLVSESCTTAELVNVMPSYTMIAINGTGKSDIALTDAPCGDFALMVLAKWEQYGDGYTVNGWAIDYGGRMWAYHGDMYSSFDSTQTWRQLAFVDDMPVITYSTTDLTAGVSELATGEVYLVYE